VQAEHGVVHVIAEELHDLGEELAETARRKATAHHRPERAVAGLLMDKSRDFH
jgi:hypothetical protein